MESLAEWHDFFVAYVGASAALAGLLFVATSINIERILKFPWLPARAGITMLLLLGALLEGSFALWPGQPLRVLGLELLAVSVGVWLAALRLSLGGPRPPREFAPHMRINDAAVQLATLSAVAGAIVMAGLAVPLGMYLSAASLLLAIVVVFINSWVLLVEILR